MNPSEQHVLGKSAAAELSDRWVKWLSMVNCIIARWPEWEPNWSPLQETSMRPQAFNIFYLHLNFNICCCNPSFSIHLHTCPRSSPLQFGHVSEPKCPYKKWPDQHASIVCLVHCWDVSISIRRCQPPLLNSTCTTLVEYIMNHISLCFTSSYRPSYLVDWVVHQPQPHQFAG
jgi:hypothetical protein